MTQKENTFTIAPQKEYLVLLICIIPLLIYCNLHLDEFSVYTAGLIGGGTAGALLSLWDGGHNFQIDSEGIHEYWFRIPIRSIPWSRVSQIVSFPYEFKKKEPIIIVLQGCKDFYPQHKVPGFFHDLHPIKTIFIDHGRYTAHFQTFFEVIISKQYGI